MSYLLNLGAWNSVFAVPTVLVDRHLKLAGSVQLKALLWLLRQDNLTLTAAAADRRSSRECDLVRRYIDDHFKENLTLDQLAALAHINKYHLVHTFRKEYNTSPISYQISRRIQESRMLLVSTDFNLSQIAQILGFSSLSYFSQSFRRLEGISPMEYRKRNRSAAR